MTRLCWIAVALAGGIAPAIAQTFPSSAGNLQVETVARGLDHPWGLAFLPDGRMLVTERPGRLRVVTRDGKLSPAVEGVPGVRAARQGGLHDVVLDRNFANNKTIYFCFAEPAEGGGRTALARAAFSDGEAPKLDDVKVIFRQDGPLSSGSHYGCRIVQGRDGNLWLTMGDHFTDRNEAQNLANHIGKIVRITPDGAVPPDNPFVGRKDAKPEIWSYGHRNSQGAALHPQTGRLWEHEHGPKGGDEVNIPLAGKNYGWPVIGYGANYTLGTEIHAARNKEGMEQPKAFFVPSIGISGLMLYTGDKFPNWKGNIFVGGMSANYRQLVRFSINGNVVTNREPLLVREYRIRDVRQGPDGFVYIAVDNQFPGQPSNIIRLEPNAAAQ